MQKATKNAANTGFTLIEILVVIGLIALLAAIVIVAINPARQFAQGRNTQRTSNINAILNVYGQRIADHKGLFHGDTATDPNCTVDIPIAAVDEANAADICGGGSVVTCPSGNFDIRKCAVPDYIAELPVDPKTGTACDTATCAGGYDTKYKIYKDVNGRVTVFAPDAQTESALDPDGTGSATPPVISVTR